MNAPGWGRDNRRGGGGGGGVALLSSIYHNVFVGLVDLDLVELPHREDLHHVVPDVHRQVLRRAARTEGGDIQLAVINTYRAQQ